MPEVGIGFIPDVGATHALSRLPDAAGTWLALTGARIDRDAARALGLVTHTASTDDLDGLVTALAQGDDMTVALAKHAPAGQSPAFLPDREAISRCFAATDMASIIRNLTNMADTSGFAARCLAELQAKSPLSLAIALEQMRLGTRLSFEEALAVEFRIVSRLVRGSDFYEGVRALIVDKDNAPHWSVAGIADVDKIEIAAYFAPLGELELWASHPTDDEAKPHHARP